MENGNILTFYALWKPREYVIRYIGLGLGADNSMNYSSYTHLSDTINLQNPTREGYTFVGWYLSPNKTDETKVTTIPSGSTGNKTLYAKWVRQ